MEAQRGGGSPFRRSRTPQPSPRADAKPFSETRLGRSRADSDEALAGARQLLETQRPSLRTLRRPSASEPSLREPDSESLDLSSALGRLTTLVIAGSIAGRIKRNAQGRVVAAFRMKTGCDPGELTRIAQALESGGECVCAFQLRVALMLDARAVDTNFMANLNAFIGLLPTAEGTMSHRSREELLAHCRSLRVLASREKFERFGDLGYLGNPGFLGSLSAEEARPGEPFDALNDVIVSLERRWMLCDPVSMGSSVDMRLEQIALDAPPKSSRRRTFSQSDGFDLRKLTGRVGNGRRWSGRTGWLLDSRLEQAFTALLDNGSVICDRAADGEGEGESEIIGFTLKPGCHSDTVANVATALEKTEPVLALLLWAAWAMNETCVEKEFLEAIASVLKLKGRIDMPSLSLWRILGELSTHVRALLTLEAAPDPDQVLLVTAPLHDCNFLAGDELLEAVRKRSCAVTERALAEQQPGGLRATAIAGMAAWGISPSDSHAMLADGGTLDSLVRLFSLHSPWSNPKQWVGDDKHGFLDFSLCKPGTSHDVLTVASAFERAGLPGFALQLLAAHLTEMVELTGADLPCVALATKIASKTDLLNGLAMRAARAILLHARLIRQCELFADAQCGDALATLEENLIGAVVVSTGGTREMLPIGTIDGVCHILDGLAGRASSEEQGQKIGQAAACLAAVDSGPGRRRIERSLQRATIQGAGGALPSVKRFAALCEAHQGSVIAQLRVPLTQQGIQWRQGKFVEPDDSSFSWKPLSCMSALTIAHVRLCRPGFTATAGDASSLIKLLHPRIAASDTSLRAALLALALRCSAARPDLRDEALDAVVDDLLAGDAVRDAMLEGDVSDLPVVLCTLVQAHWFTTDVRKKVFKHIVDSAEFAVVMASGSAPCMLDEALAQIGTDPMSLRRTRTRRLLRQMITPRACRGSLRAMARPMLLQTLNDRSPRGLALIEALCLLDHGLRKPLVDQVMAHLNARNKEVDLGDLTALATTLGQPISSTWSRRSGQRPPGFVTAAPSLFATWLGTGVADAGKPANLLQSLAAVLRHRRDASGSEWRDSAAGLVFAIRVALRASAGVADDVLDAVVTAAVSRGSRKYGRSELFAHASLLACRWVLAGRSMPMDDSSQVALLARLMCAALALDMKDPAPCADHLAWVDAHVGKVEPGLLDATWFSDMRAKLHIGLQALTA